MNTPTPIRPPFTCESATASVRAAEDAWNSRDPNRVTLAYTQHSEWRNRSCRPSPTTGTRSGSPHIKLILDRGMRYIAKLADPNAKERGDKSPPPDYGHAHVGNAWALASAPVFVGERTG